MNDDDRLWKDLQDNWTGREYWFSNKSRRYRVHKDLGEDLLCHRYSAYFEVEEMDTIEKSTIKTFVRLGHIVRTV